MTCRTVLVCLVFALAPDAMRAAQPKPPAIDVSGTWSLIATHKGLPGMPDGVSFRATITLKQRGGVLDGHLAHQNGNDGAFTGVVIDKAVTFTALIKSSERPGVTHILDFTGGTLDGERTLKGHVTSVSTGPGTYMRGEGPYVATRR